MYPPSYVAVSLRWSGVQWQDCLWHLRYAPKYGGENSSLRSAIISIQAGVGLSTYPFSSTDGFWKWIQMCEEGDVDSVWQADTLVSKESMLECMTTMAVIAGAALLDIVTVVC